MAATAQQEREIVRAQARWVRMPARKARLVADHIRGRTVPEARTILAFTTRHAAVEIDKVLRSAVANAENNHNLDVDDLVVAQAWTGKNLVLKRFHARGRGRGAGILKPFSEVTIILCEQKAPAEEKKAAPKKGAKDNGKSPRAPARPRSKRTAQKEQA